MIRSVTSQLQFVDAVLARNLEGADHLALGNALT